MSISQIYNKVLSSGPIRAYLAADLGDEFHYGQRGSLIPSSEGELLFESDCGNGFIIEFNNEIHAPSIGHYSWK